MRKKCSRQAGMSLIEVVVTMFLVTMGLLVLMTSFIAIAKAHRFSERMDVATAIACLEMERIRNLPFPAVVSEEGAYNEYPEHPDYRHQMVVSDLGTVKQVTLRILFERDQRRAEMMTFITNI